MDFQSYSVIKANEDDSQLYSSVDSDIDLIKTFMGEDYVAIPKNENSYVVSFSTDNQGLTYILNIENGLFWGHISYPE